MIDDATVFRLGDDNFRFVGGDDYDGVWLKELAERLGLQGVRQAVHRPAPQPRRAGTESREILQELIWTPPARSPRSTS